MANWGSFDHIIHVNCWKLTFIVRCTINKSTKKKWILKQIWKYGKALEVGDIYWCIQYFFNEAEYDITNEEPERFWKKNNLNLNYRRNMSTINLDYKYRMQNVVNEIWTEMDTHEKAAHIVFQTSTILQMELDSNF